VALIRVGEKYALARYQILYEGDPRGAEALTARIEPKVVYQVEARVDPPIRETGGLYDLLRALEAKYPGIGVNYIEVSDDGRKVTLQLFDPPGITGVAIAEIVKYIVLAIIVYFLVQLVVNIRLLVELLVKALAIPEWIAPVIWIGAGIVIIGGGLLLLRRAVAPREKRGE
jgi:hypothetical protein